MKKFCVYILQLIAAYMLGLAGFLKITGHPHEVELFMHIGMEPHGRIIIGLLELLAAALLVIPQSGLYGAVLGLGIMIGAVIGHLTNIGMGGINNAFLVLGCCTLVIFLRRSEAEIFKNMFNES